MPGEPLVLFSPPGLALAGLQKAARGAFLGDSWPAGPEPPAPFPSEGAELCEGAPSASLPPLGVGVRGSDLPSDPDPSPFRAAIL